MTSTPPLVSIVTSGDDIRIVNQLLLPHTTEWLEISSIEAAHEAIKSMKIRGAPAIASLAALSLASHISRALKQDPRPPFLETPFTLKAYIEPLLSFLYTARPTAVNLGTATRRIQQKIDELTSPNEERILTADQVAVEVIAEARAIADEDVDRNKEMSRRGAEWLIQRIEKSGQTVEDRTINVLTVCNTGSLATSGYGTALGLITHLFETNKLKRAYYTQTGPYHQGSRLTSLELQTLRIPSTMICDTMVGSLFQHHPIHAVVVGADRIVANGDTANKIGTYNAAVLAARHNIPFIVVAPVSTLDLEKPDGSHIPIEQRPALEACLVRGLLYPPLSHDELQPGQPQPQATVMITPSGIDLEQGVYNPSFDVTPAELITAIVTEKGVAVKKAGSTVFDLSSVA